MKLDLLLTKFKSLTMFALVAILFLLSSFLVFPQVDQIKKSYSTMDAQQKKLDQLKEKLKELEGLNEFELRKKAEISLKAVPQESDPLSLIYSASQLAKDSGLIIKNVSSGNKTKIITKDEINTEDKNTSGINSLILSLEGPQDMIKAYIASLNKILPIISVNAVNVTTEEDSDAPVTSVTLSSSYLPLPANLGKVDSPLPKFTVDQEKVILNLGEFSVVPESTASGQVNGGEGRINPFSL